MHKNSKDLTGQRSGRLIALKPTDKRKDRKVVWLCQCDCGNVCFVSSNHFQDGNTQSCGCLHRDRTSETHRIHGMCGTPLYDTWNTMMARCYNPKNPAYKNYGGRGINVCERWHDPRNFYADMGDRPEGLTLERKDNNGNYEFNNCEWASRKTQSRNSRPKSCGPCKQRWFYAWHKDSMVQYLNNNQGEFARKHGLSQGAVSACILGKAKQTKGWIFRPQEVPHD